MLLRARKLNQYLPEELKEIGGILAKNNFNCYLVGGALRDLLLGQDVEDFDLATDATPDEVQKIFTDNIPTGKKYGTIMIKYKERHYEVTTLRKESNYSDNRHPEEIEFTKDIREDLNRRDFTINALAYQIEKAEMLDQFNGLEDLKNRILRTVGNPEARFAEDGLRVIRTIRFLAQTGFALELGTAQALLPRLKDWVTLAAKERIFNELDKTINFNAPDYGLSLLNFPKVNSLDKQLRWAAIIKAQPEVFDLIQEKQKRRWIEKLLKFDLDLNKASLEVTDLKLDGLDIMELGPRGEEVGRILESLLTIIIEKRNLNKKSTLLELAKDLIAGLSVEDILANEAKKKELKKTSII